MKLERIVGLMLLLVLLATPFAAGAQTIYPEDGWWWNPQEPGRGYMIERQEDTIFFMSFASLMLSSCLLCSVLCLVDPVILR